MKYAIRNYKSKKTLKRILLIFSLFLVISFFLNMSLQIFHVLSQIKKDRQTATYMFSSRVKEFDILSEQIDNILFSFQVDSTDAVPFVANASREEIESYLLPEKDYVITERGNTVPFIKDSYPYRVVNRLKGVIQSSNTIGQISVYLPQSDYIIGFTRDGLTTFAGDAEIIRNNHLLLSEETYWKELIEGNTACSTYYSTGKDQSYGIILSYKLKNGLTLLIKLAEQYMLERIIDSSFTPFYTASYIGLLSPLGGGVEYSASSLRYQSVQQEFFQAVADLEAGEDMELLSGNYYMLAKKTNLLNLNYVIILEDSFKKLFYSYLLKASVLYGIIWLVLGGMAAIHLTGILYKPLQSLVRQLSLDIESENYKDDYERISKAIQLIIEQNSLNNQKISNQEILLRNSLLVELFINGNITYSNNSNVLKKYDIPSLLESYYVIVIKLDIYIPFSNENGYAYEYDYYEEQIKLLMEELYSMELEDELLALLYTRSQLLGILKPTGTKGPEDIFRNLSLIATQISDTLGMTIRIFCSDIHQGVSEAAYSYNEAISRPACSGDTFQASPLPNKNIVYNSKKMFGLELKMVNLILSEEYGKAYLCFEEIINFIYLENNHIIGLSEKLITGLAARTYCVLLEANVLNKGKINHVLFLQQLSNCDNKEVQLCYWRNIFTSLQEKNLENTEYSVQFNKILNYVNQNYHNCLLSQTMVAQEFGVSASYISREFQKNMGIGFLDYLHRLRVEAAKKEILYTSKPIKDIAPLVGYTNILTMSRAFKKLEGITPGSLR